MSTSLHTLLEHAERQRDAALSAVQQAEAAVQRLEQQAQQLTAYRDETRERHPAQGGRTATMELLRCHEGFVARLEQALTQQLVQVKSAQSRVASLRKALLAHETRVASVRKLQQRRSADAQVHAGRLDQRRSDDAAQRRRDGGTSGWRLGSDVMPLSN